MKLATPHSLSPPIKKFIETHPPSDAAIPGVIVGVDEMLARHPQLNQSISKMYPGVGSIGAPYLVVKPEQAPLIFSENELDLLKSVASKAAEKIHPVLKYGIDGLWLWYRGKKLYKKLRQPDRNIGACLFEAAGLGLGLAKTVGSAYPGLKIPDSLSYDISFIAKGGKAICEGKAPPVIEMMLSRDKGLEIPLKCLKVAGLSLDPEYPKISAVPLSVVKKPTKEKPEKSA
jgi:hypothetical protein